MGRCSRAVFLLGGLLLLSCKAPTVNLGDAAKEIKSKDYEAYFETWTRHGEVYNLDTLENSLKVSATYLSWEMRQAYVARYCADYGLDEVGKQAMLDKERALLEASNEFLVAATATNQKWAYFHKADSPWRITLITNQGVEVPYTLLERVRKPSPMLIAYFPVITIYREVYRFYFPLVEGTSGMRIIKPALKSFSLVFAGALGRVELKWKVKQPKKANP
jgi:hypothetical protein